MRQSVLSVVGHWAFRSRVAEAERAKAAHHPPHRLQSRHRTAVRAVPSGRWQCSLVGPTATVSTCKCSGRPSISRSQPATNSPATRSVVPCSYEVVGQMLGRSLNVVFGQTSPFTNREAGVELGSVVVEEGPSWVFAPIDNACAVRFNASSPNGPPPPGPFNIRIRFRVANSNAVQSSGTGYGTPVAVVAPTPTPTPPSTPVGRPQWPPSRADESRTAISGSPRSSPARWSAAC